MTEQFLGKNAGLLLDIRNSAAALKHDTQWPDRKGMRYAPEAGTEIDPISRVAEIAMNPGAHDWRRDWVVTDKQTKGKYTFVTRRRIAKR